MTTNCDTLRVSSAGSAADVRINGKQSLDRLPPTDRDVMGDRPIIMEYLRACVFPGPFDDPAAGSLIR